MTSNEEGVHLIYWPKQPRWGEGTPLKIKKKPLSKPIRPKVLHCATECVTLCWSASEGLSPQLGKEASLLPSNTIHTLLTLPSPVPPQSSSALPSRHPLYLLPHRSMGDYVWCDDRMHVCCLPWREKEKNATDRISLLFASSGEGGAGGGRRAPRQENHHTCRGSRSRGPHTHRNIHISWGNTLSLAGFDWIYVWYFVEEKPHKTIGEIVVVLDVACFCFAVELHCAGSSLFGACYVRFEQVDYMLDLSYIKHKWQDCTFFKGFAAFIRLISL